LPEWTAQRQKIAARYRAALKTARVDLPQDDPRSETAYHLFTVYAAQRDTLRKQLQAREIETAVHYPRPLHLQPAYASLGYPPGTFPHAERACERAFSLPLFPGMTLDQVNFVADAVRELTTATIQSR
jgi:dTDP-4-amino-4,6-dideoxygalactose transaminase